MTKYPSKTFVVLAAMGTLTAHLGAAWLSSDMGFASETASNAPVMLSVVIPEADKPSLPSATRAVKPSPVISEIANTITPTAAVAPEEATTLPTQVAAAETQLSDSGAAIATAPTEVAAVTPKSGVLVFDVYLGAAESDPLARMTHELKFTDQGYEISSRGEALGLLASLYSGLLTQRSAGLMEKGDFQPKSYSEQKGKKPESVTVFDYTSASIQFAGAAGQPLPEKTQDRLSVIYSLTSYLKDGSQKNTLPKPGDVISYKVANTQSIEDFDFECTGYEPISLQNGEARALKFRRVKNSNGEKTSIELWFNPLTDWLPIQIRLTDKRGMVITQRLHG